MDPHTPQGSPYAPTSGSSFWSRLPAAYAIGVMIACLVVGSGIFAAWFHGRPVIVGAAPRKDTPVQPLVLPARRPEQPGPKLPPVPGLERKQPLKPPFQHQPAHLLGWLPLQ